LIIEKEQIDKLKTDIENILLQQDINTLENSLSNVIMFFQLVLGVAAILLIIVGWWMSRIFANKLDEVKDNAKMVDDKLKKVQQSEDEILNKSKEINILHESISNWKDFKQNTREDVEGLRSYIRMLEEALLVDYEVNTFRDFEHTINETEPRITEDMISTYFGDSEDSYEYESKKNYYLEAKEHVERVNFRSKLDYRQFVIDEDEAYEKLSNELKDDCDDAKDFLELLLNILNK